MVYIKRIFFALLIIPILIVCIVACTLLSPISDLINYIVTGNAELFSGFHTVWKFTDLIKEKLKI